MKQQLIEVSNTCLLPNQSQVACQHPSCILAHKKPHYFGITEASVLEDKKEFTHFTKSASNFDHTEWLLIVNPIEAANATERSNYEFFRQAHTLEASGSWPADRTLFHRNEVKIIHAEYETSRTKIDDAGKVVEYFITDVKEVAVFKPIN